MSEVATGLSTCVLKDGTQIITANIPMAGFKFTGMGSGSAAANAVAYGQLAADFISTVSATGQTNIEFTGLNSNYRQHILRLSNVLPGTANTTLFVRVSTDNGATFITSEDYSAATSRCVATAGAVVTAIASSSYSGMPILFNINNGGSGLSAEIVLDNLSSSDLSKQVTWTGSATYQSSTNTQKVEGSAMYNAGVTAIDAIRLVFNTGVFASGYGMVSLYGIKAT